MHRLQPVGKNIEANSKKYTTWLLRDGPAWQAPPFRQSWPAGLVLWAAHPRLSHPLQCLQQGW